jgi:plastocyanin
MRTLFSITFLVFLLCTPAFAGTIYQVAEAHLDADGVQRLEVVADSYFFEPNYLVVRAGIPMELTITRQSWLVPHDFVLHAPEAGMDVRKAIGTDGTKVRFTPTQPGKYTFHCSKQLLFFESHRDMGMEGVLEVKP